MPRSGSRAASARLPDGFLVRLEKGLCAAHPKPGAPPRPHHGESAFPCEEPDARGGARGQGGRLMGRPDGSAGGPGGGHHPPPTPHPLLRWTAVVGGGTEPMTVCITDRRLWTWIPETSKGREWMSVGGKVPGVGKWMSVRPIRRGWGKTSTPPRPAPDAASLLSAGAASCPLPCGPHRLPPSMGGRHTPRRTPGLPPAPWRTTAEGRRRARLRRSGRRRCRSPYVAPARGGRRRRRREG